MQAAGLRGCVIYTSSPAGFMATPFTSMYGSTKAFVTALATCIAGEVKSDGIDVMAFHPSPVNSNFAAGVSHKIGMMDLCMAGATTPDTIAGAMLESVGRTVIRDQGWYSIGLRIVLKVRGCCCGGSAGSMRRSSFRRSCARAHTHTHTHKHTRTHTHVHTHMLTHTHAHTQVHAHTHIHALANFVDGEPVARADC
jgi:hypothetical protein